ncbi:15654_t:CDS:2, partial [Gigaspora margarita]
MSNDQLTINTLRELNSRHVLQIDELRKKNAEVKVENTRLLTAENAELKHKSTACLELSVNVQIQAQSIISSEIRDESKPTRPESLAEFETSLSRDTINDDLVETLEFGEKQKKETSESRLMQSISFSSDIQNNELNPVIDTHERKLPNQNQYLLTNTKYQSKIPYNKRVEQDLKHNLSSILKKANNNNKIYNVFYIQIPEFSLEPIITGSTKVIAQNISDLFILAIKVLSEDIINKKDKSLSEKE